MSVTWQRVLLLVPTCVCFAYSYAYWRAYQNPNADTFMKHVDPSIGADPQSPYSPLPERVQLLAIALVCGLLGVAGLVIASRGILWGR
jgi:hypothetical protein